MDVLSGIIISVTGVVFGLIVFKEKQRDNYSAKLFNDYKQMAQELATILEDLLTLSMLPRDYSIEYCRSVDNELSKYFFKYYLLLPQHVLEEINCLHSCLQCRGKYFYMIDRKGDVPVLRQCKTTKEFNDLFTDVALIETKLLDRYDLIPRHLALRCQARHVITVMHNCWDYKVYHKWQRKLPKRTVFQIVNPKHTSNNN